MVMMTIEEDEEENQIEIEPLDFKPELQDDCSSWSQKVRKICRTFRKSPKKNDYLQDFVMDINNGQRLNLILDVKTRWNSLLHMLERFLKLKDCIPSALRAK